MTVQVPVEIKAISLILDPEISTPNSIGAVVLPKSAIDVSVYETIPESHPHITTPERSAPAVVSDTT